MQKGEKSNDFVRYGDHGNDSNDSDESDSVDKSNKDNSRVDRTNERTFHVETEQGVFWYKGDVLHRCDVDGNNVDLPAIERLNGSREWWVNGKRHRCNADGNNVDLPAVLTFFTSRFSDKSVLATREWWVNGKRSRCNANGDNTDFPALDYSKFNKKKEWWVKGIRHRPNGLPAVEDTTNNQTVWYLNGMLHRDNDLPAVIGPFSQEWWNNNVFIKSEYTIDRLQKGIENLQKGIEKSSDDLRLLLNSIRQPQ